MKDRTAIVSGVGRSLSANIGRYRTGTIARRFAEDLALCRIPRRALRNTAIARARRSPSLRPTVLRNVLYESVKIHGTACGSAKRDTFSTCCGSTPTAGPYSVFVPEAGEYKLLTTTGPSCPCCRSSERSRHFIPPVILDRRALHAARFAMRQAHRFARRDPLLWLASGPCRRRAMFTMPNRALVSANPIGSNGPPYQSSIALCSSYPGSRNASRKPMKSSGPPTTSGGQRRAPPTEAGYATVPPLRPSRSIHLR